MKKILFIQFVDSFYNYESTEVDYYKNFYQSNQAIGYKRSQYNFEIPQ